jgi:hypothetical protein
VPPNRKLGGQIQSKMVLTCSFFASLVVILSLLLCIKSVVDGHVLESVTATCNPNDFGAMHESVKNHRGYRGITEKFLPVFKQPIEVHYCEFHLIAPRNNMIVMISDQQLNQKPNFLSSS